MGTYYESICSISKPASFASFALFVVPMHCVSSVGSWLTSFLHIISVKVNKRIIRSLRLNYIIYLVFFKFFSFFFDGLSSQAINAMSFAVSILLSASSRNPFFTSVLNKFHFVVLWSSKALRRFYNNNNNTSINFFCR